jgi:hypothetical protein
VWFLRKENGVLRPTFDWGTYTHIGLLTKWESVPDPVAPHQLGVLLLTPAANAETLVDYASYLWQVGDVACELLGKAECTERIRNLAHLGNPALREAACGFLKGQLDASCGAI